MRPVEIYDTTLRDGTQGQGFTLTSADKVAIAQRLDAFGVDFIEGGWPGSNPKDVEFFARMRDVPLVQARLAAFGSTRHKGRRAEDDPNLGALMEAGTSVVTVFGKSWTMHVTEALGATLDQNLDMIRDSVAYLVSQGREVVYDAEHFYDGCAADPDYAFQTLAAAVEGGASRLVLCDTNGGTLPEEIAARVREVARRFDAPVGIHTHNDAELAVANALAAVQAGAGHVQGTIGGYGERCGNANLVSVLANLTLKLGCPQPQNLSQLRELARYVDERANLQPDLRAPYVGDAAFAHKGGVHVSAVAKLPETYEHVVPESVGNERRILLSDLSGRANVLAKGDGDAGGEASEGARDVVMRMKELEHRGYAFEGAEASFQLMARKVRGEHRAYFTVHGYTVVIDKRDHERQPRSEASVKVEVDGMMEHTAADGDGPVNALDRALGKALRRFYPEIADVYLTDYKVRVLGGDEAGTASVIRVQVEFSDGGERWGTVGASTDIIDASYEALIDAIEYKLVKDGVAPRDASTEATAAP
ncbi:MAG: citramalate synthase [Trueperaceae bacterium]|nr:citramalate synthase [Trueperaceae bacterium]